MKLICDFEKVEMDGQIIAVSINKTDKQNLMLRLNETASDILDLLKSDTDEETIVSELAKVYDNENGEINEYVHSFLESLKENGLII